MSQTQDKLNCIKNLILMMCCDGRIADREKKFLSRAAKDIDLKVDNWNELLKDVSASPTKIYTISDPDKAVATLKSLVVMAKADQHVDQREKDYLVQFAKSIGLSNDQWKQTIKNIDLDTLFDPFKTSQAALDPEKPATKIVVLKEDFDKLDEFTNVARENNMTTHITGFDEFITQPAADSDIVCFHASQDRNKSVRKCKQLLEKSPKNTTGILTRYQGHQVQYMLEQGLKKCIIEPVYSHDIHKLLH